MIQQWDTWEVLNMSLESWVQRNGIKMESIIVQVRSNNTLLSPSSDVKEIFIDSS